MRLLPLRPLQPSVSGPDHDLPEVDRFLCDPTDHCRYTETQTPCFNHSPLSSSVGRRCNAAIAGCAGVHKPPFRSNNRTAGCACRSAATTDFRHTFRDQSCIGLTTGSPPERHLTDANWTRSVCSASLVRRSNRPFFCLCAVTHREPNHVASGVPA